MCDHSSISALIESCGPNTENVRNRKNPRRVIREKTQTTDAFQPSWRRSMPDRLCCCVVKQRLSCRIKGFPFWRADRRDRHYAGERTLLGCHLFQRKWMFRFDSAERANWEPTRSIMRCKYCHGPVQALKESSDGARAHIEPDARPPAQLELMPGRRRRVLRGQLAAFASLCSEPGSRATWHRTHETFPKGQVPAPYRLGKQSQNRSDKSNRRIHLCSAGAGRSGTSSLVRA